MVLTTILTMSGLARHGFVISCTLSPFSGHSGEQSMFPRVCSWISCGKWHIIKRLSRTGFLPLELGGGSLYCALMCARMCS